MARLSYLHVLYYQGEGKEEYQWCINSFLDCMGGVKPIGILTDQCSSIEFGIRTVFGSDTIHRYCSWHILHKLSSKWGNIEHKDALTILVKDVVYTSLTESEFKERWDNLMAEIGMKTCTIFFLLSMLL
jgi:hypothetical protein